MSPVTINGPRLRGRDGFSELVIERDPDGRLRISVHDETGPGVTATFGETDSGVIADFIKGGRMSPRLITDAQAEEWRYDLRGDGHRYRFEPVTGLFMPRARMTVLEDDRAGEPVIVTSFAADVIEEFGDYLRRLADYLKGNK